MRKQRIGSPYECVMCSKIFSTLNIAQHLKHNHEMKTNEYYDLVNPEAKNKCCLHCNNPTKFINIVKGYADFCSKLCTNASVVRTTKIVNSKRSKYGNDFKPIYEKQKATNLAKTQEEKDKLSNTNYILEKIIENAPIMIFWKDKDGIYQGSNTHFLDLMNLKDKEELIGKKDSDFNISEKEDFMNDDIFVMSNKKPKLNYIETITAKDKNIKTINTSKVPLIDDKGEVIGVLGVINDITEQINNQKQINTIGSISEIGKIVNKF